MRPADQNVISVICTAIKYDLFGSGERAVGVGSNSWIRRGTELMRLNENTALASGTTKPITLLWNMSVGVVAKFYCDLLKWFNVPAKVHFRQTGNVKFVGVESDN